MHCIAGLEGALAARLWGRWVGVTGAAPEGGASRVGQRARVFWPEDQDWYEAVVRAWDPEARCHNLWYPYDEQVSGSLS